jgi:hypothetical protein
MIRSNNKDVKAFIIPTLYMNLQVDPSNETELKPLKTKISTGSSKINSQLTGIERCETKRLCFGMIAPSDLNAQFMALMQGVHGTKNQTLESKTNGK